QPAQDKTRRLALTGRICRDESVWPGASPEPAPARAVAEDISSRDEVHPRSSGIGKRWPGGGAPAQLPPHRTLLLSCPAQQHDADHRTWPHYRNPPRACATWERGVRFPRKCASRGALSVSVELDKRSRGAGVSEKVQPKMRSYNMTLGRR